MPQNHLAAVFTPKLPKYVKHSVMRKNPVHCRGCLSRKSASIALIHGARQIIATLQTMIYSQEEKTLMFISHEFHIVKKKHVQNNTIKNRK